jgi:hypothetical protein
MNEPTKVIAYHMAVVTGGIVSIVLLALALLLG